MLVEDNEINQQVARELLEAMNLRVTVAGDGQEALDRLQESEFDLVLMDIQMPVMDGHAATRKIREQERFANLPVIAMTAHAMAGDRERAAQSGMNDHVTKPIDPKQLVQVLSNWLERSTEQSTGGPQEDSHGLPTLRCFQVEAGLARLNGNQKLYRKLLVKFRQDCRETSKLLADLARTDQQQMAAAVHTLKGVSGSLGAERIYKACQRYEAASEEKRDKLLVALQAELETALLELEDVTVEESDASRPTSAALDMAQLVAGLEQLREALDDGNALAGEQLEPLRGAVKKLGFEKALDEISSLVEVFELDEASAAVTRLLEGLQTREP